MAHNPDIDRTDFNILGLLMNDARLSNKEIAAAVGLAPSSCYERLKALRNEGVLRGFHADVDLASLGLAIEALLFVQVAKLDAEQVDVLVHEIASVREVRTVFLVSGHFDLIVHLAVGDMKQLKLVISEHFNRHACVLRVESSVVFNRQTQFSIPIEVS
jgi:DNA-binding Lrp family transcriptional regulator